MIVQKKDANAHPVVDMELLGFDTLVVENQSAIGQYAVHVRDDQFDRLTAGF